MMGTIIAHGGHNSDFSPTTLFYIQKYYHV